MSLCLTNSEELAGEMVQQVKVLAAKPSGALGTHVTEEETHLYTVTFFVYTQISK